MNAQGFDNGRWNRVRAIDLAMAALVVLGVLLAWTLPVDLYDRSQAAKTFADAVAKVVRGIDEFAAISSFPGVTRLVLATLWVCVPLVASYIAFAPGVLKWDSVRLRAMPRLVRWAIVGMFILMSIVAPILITFDPDVLQGNSFFDLMVNFVSTHRLGLGLVAGVYCAVSALFLSLLPIYLNRRNF